MNQGRRHTLESTMPSSLRQSSFTYPAMRKSVFPLVLGVSLLMPIPALGGALEGALDFGKDLLAKATMNYTSHYERQLTQLLHSLRQPAVEQPFVQSILPVTPYDPYATGGQMPYDPNTSSYEYGPTDPTYGNPSEGTLYGHTSENAYPSAPPYEGYSSPDPIEPPYGYGQSQHAPHYPDMGNTGHAPLPQQEFQDPYPPYTPYAGGGYPEQPPSPLQQDTTDPYNLSKPDFPQQPIYSQPIPPQAPQEPQMQPYDALAGQHLMDLQLDVALVKKTVMNGAEILQPIKDGDILKDGRGNPRAGDKFRVMFRANSDCYLYVIAIDGTGWAQGIFPALTSPFANPVKPGQQYILPENNQWFSLDQFTGVETIFFVASPDKRQDIEDILTDIAGRERHPKTRPEQVVEAPIIPAGYHGSRQGLSPFKVHPDGSSEHNLIPTTYFTHKAGEALRVTRWFRHE